MDLIKAIKDKINTLESGNYSKGLNAILTHIEVAFRHLERGQRGDFPSFTDVIYRTNQAFEGSIKELYRVLTHKDPSKKTLNDIEKYLTDNNTFRPRVLEQFTSYRKNWRNPSTHDYHLDFDDREAYLAIITVSAFTYLLISQIEDTLVTQSVEKEIKLRHLVAHVVSATKNNNFIAQVIELLQEFCTNKNFVDLILAGTTVPRISEHRFKSVLAGYLKSVTPTILVEIEPLLQGNIKIICPDIILTRESEKIIFELKRYNKKTFERDIESGVEQVENYMNFAKINTSIIFYFSDQLTKLNIKEINKKDNKIIILTPELNS